MPFQKHMTLKTYNHQYCNAEPMQSYAQMLHLNNSSTANHLKIFKTVRTKHLKKSCVHLGIIILFLPKMCACV